MTAAEIRALIAAATPGPWKVILPGDVSWSDRRKYRCIAFSTRRDESYTTSPIEPADAALIAALATEAPALLDRLERALFALETPMYSWLTEYSPEKAWEEAMDLIRAALGETR